MLSLWNEQTVLIDAEHVSLLANEQIRSVVDGRSPDKALALVPRDAL